MEETLKSATQTSTAGPTLNPAGPTLNPAENPASPYYFPPSEHPSMKIIAETFTGDNYESWSRAVERALRSKNKLAFIDGSIAIPSLSDSVMRDAWERADALVLSWLDASMDEEIRRSLLHLTTARHVWLEMRMRYAKLEGIPRGFQLEMYLSSISKGTQSITQYYNTFKALWDDYMGWYMSYQPILHCTCGACTCNFLEANLTRKAVMTFLVGLDDSYSNFKSKILLYSPLPSLPEVYSMLIEEEAQMPGQDESQLQMIFSGIGIVD